MADDGFEVLISRKSKKRQRVCVSNFCSRVNVDDELVEIFEQAGISISPSDIEHIQGESNNKPSYVVVCEDAGRAISLLNGKTHNGMNLVLKRDSTTRQGKKGKSTFCANSWSKPAVVATIAQKPMKIRPPTYAVERSVVKIKSEDDPINEPITSTATMALLASMDAFGADLSISGGVVEDASEEADRSAPTLEEFKANCKVSLSRLLADYGEQDLDFKNKKVDEQLEEDDDADCEAEQESIQSPQFQNRLGQHGKAPIHVVLTSFGYCHRAPTVKNWSHAQPLQPVDCRHLHETPYWLVRPDGRNPSVKRAILNEETRQLCKSVATQVVDALQEAIEAGFGHAMPLRMSIYAGSEIGRHRSVVVCEATGIILRKLLRTNEGDRINVPVSVGTLHQDVDRKQRETKARPEYDADEKI